MNTNVSVNVKKTGEQVHERFKNRSDDARRFQEAYQKKAIALYPDLEIKLSQSRMIHV